MRLEIENRSLVEFELGEAKSMFGQSKSHLVEIESKFRESEKMVAESVSKLADAESRFSNAKVQLSNFDLLYEVMSQFPDFNELERDLEYNGLNYAV